MSADLLQNSADGIALGASYALLAVGFTLVFGVLRRVNLAYGASIMMGLYGAIWIHERVPLPFPLVIVAVVLVTVAAGVYVERLCFAPHARRAAVIPMAASFAVWMQLEEAVTLLVPRHASTFPSPFGVTTQTLASMTLRPEQVLALVCAILIAFGLWRLLYHSRFGLAVRALIENRQAAACVGIPVGRVAAAIFALASALGGVAGYLIVVINGQITPMFAMWATLKGMLAAMLGGLGSLAGAIVGGLLLGLMEVHCQSLAGPQYRDLSGYLLLFALLWLYPAGLSGLWRRDRQTFAGTPA